MWSRETSYSALSLYGHKNFKFTVSFHYPSSTLASFGVHLGMYSYVSNPAKEKGIIKATRKLLAASLLATSLSRRLQYLFYPP